MRILLTSNASYAPPRGGSTRSNLVWLRYLAASGHACRVLSASLADDFESANSGIAIRGVKNLALRGSVVAEEMQSFRPDYVLVSSEDLSHILLRAAGRAAPGRLVYLAHTPQFFPFGPESWNADPHAAAIVRDALGVVSIGHHTAGYITRHLGSTPAVIHPPIYGTPPPSQPALRFNHGSVLMINPCQVKGITIFLELARRFAETSFTALTGWGTTTEDRAALSQWSNVHLLESVPDIEDVLANTRILLMPSLWYEGFGLIAMEALLRGIPVIASDSGGLVEAKQGTGFVIAVRPIERYLPEFDEMHMPKPVLPRQDLEPWTQALTTLLSDRAVYEAEAVRSAAAAHDFVSRLDPAGLNRFLATLTPRANNARALLLEQRMRRRAKK